jgi:hypothetical protein
MGLPSGWTLGLDRSVKGPFRRTISHGLLMTRTHIGTRKPRFFNAAFNCLIRTSLRWFANVNIFRALAASRRKATAIEFSAVASGLVYSGPHTPRAGPIGR